MKTCTRCNKEKPETEFYLRKSGDIESGRRAWCKVCARPVRSAAQKKRAAEWQRTWRNQNPGANWRRYLKTYGVTPEWYEEQVERQGSGCAICGQKCSTGSRFSVDHDHRCCPAPPVCGQCVRGLLCRSCNVGIGNLGDDPERLRAAVRYLEG